MSIIRPMILLWLAVAASTTLLGTGCSRSNGGVSATQSKAFDSAPADVRETWQKALAADAATNYMDTLNLLNSLKLMQLSDEQRDVLNKKFTDFDQRLWAAAAKKDPSALQAVQAMRTRPLAAPN